MRESSLDKLGRLVRLAYVGAIGIPLFIFPGYRTTNLSLIFSADHPAHFDPEPLRIHWIVVWTGLVLLYLILEIPRTKELEGPPRGWLTAALFLIFLISLIAGLLIDPGKLNFVYFAQTAIPLCGFVVGAHLARSFCSMRQTIFILIFTTTLSILFILMIASQYGAFNLAMPAANRLARVIPQLRDYFPFVVVCSLSMALALFRIESGRIRLLLGAAIIIHLGFYILNWSRMGLIMLAVVAITPLMFRRASGETKTTWSRAGVPIILFLIAIFLTAAGVLGSRLQRTELLSRSDHRRAQYAMSSIRMIADHPLFGRMFIPDWEYDPYPKDRELSVPRMFKAHNQYLDYGIRAGVPAIAALLLMFAFVAHDLRSTLRLFPADSAFRKLAIGLAGALLALLVGNLTQLLLVQAQTGALAWLLIGVAVQVRYTAEETSTVTPHPENPQATLPPVRHQSFR